MGKPRVKGFAGMLALDWVDALLILITVYGLIGLQTWLSGDTEDLYMSEAVLFPAMMAGPMTRRFTLGVPVRHVKKSFSISGLFATLAIVFGALIAAFGAWVLYTHATMPPPALEIPERDEFAERWNAEISATFEGQEVREFDPDSLPEGTVVETIELGVKPKTPEELEAEARAEHAEEMAKFQAFRNGRLLRGLKIGGSGLLLLLLGGWLDGKRKLKEPPAPTMPPSV